MTMLQNGEKMVAKSKANTQNKQKKNRATQEEKMGYLLYE